MMRFYVVIFCFFLFIISATAGNSSYFSFNEERIVSATHALSLIEETVLNHEISDNPFSDTLKKQQATIPLYGIPSFLWGFIPGLIGGCSGPCTYGVTCILSLTGVGIFYFLSDENKEETKKAIYGWAAGTAAGTVISVGLVVLLYGSMLYSMGI